jgi:hypothetical protein
MIRKMCGEKGLVKFSLCAPSLAQPFRQLLSTGRLKALFANVVYAGVSADGKRWLASYYAHGMEFRLGYFASEVDAARAHDK